MTKETKIDDLIAFWLDTADLDTIYEYAEQKYGEWLIEQKEEWINETHEEFCGTWVEPEATIRVIET